MPMRTYNEENKDEMSGCAFEFETLP